MGTGLGIPVSKGKSAPAWEGSSTATTGPCRYRKKANPVLPVRLVRPLCCNSSTGELAANITAPRYLAAGLASEGLPGGAGQERGR